MSEPKAATFLDGRWHLTSDVGEIFAAGENAIFVDSIEALKAELKKRHDIGLEPGLTKVIADSCGYRDESVRVLNEPIIDSDRIQTQDQVEALCRKAGNVNLNYLCSPLLNNFDRGRYKDHPEFICDYGLLTFDPAKKRSILKRIKRNKERLDSLGVIRAYDLRLLLMALHDALLSTPFGVAIQRFTFPKSTEKLTAAIVECYKVATFLQVRDKVQEQENWKNGLKNIAPLLRKYAKDKKANRSFVTIATNEYRLAGISIRTQKEKNHGKV